ncbi:ABC-type molybdate transport system permease subunit [Halanaerobium saccharolyticum]|uniref:ABC-type molybdate transport system permease subunit n=1 Tax=Halanaerobium saccharolyticum TaxID=43595 RepID=A0A4R7Z7W1_9FIRM|nr:ABC transporter permease subunit [Halanaerobium saccharolyticum]RAK10546.1 ABC-type molybdate transport system permease subunit [Halanaerobium saccharolyticum]TDW06697.1 ABC-type molybdate transport system permease subunit [Halanaerobium saccharolyticum]TDX62332.1 ABC-type molybdate transport system permease subunit [Halanaerobium saccharolyticum]
MSENVFLETEKKNKSYQKAALFSPAYFNNFQSFSFSAQILIILTAAMNIIFIGFVISSLFIESSVTDIINVFSSVNILSAFKITFLSLSISASLTVLLGTPFSYLISRRNQYINKILNILISLPLLLPLFTLTLKNSFSSIDENIIEAAVVEGAAENDLLFKVYLPLSLRGFTTALIISVLRAAGEFGATIIFAGNMSGKTQTLTTAIYSLTQTNLSQAVALAVIMISAFLLPLFLVEFKVKV